MKNLERNSSCSTFDRINTDMTSDGNAFIERIAVYRNDVLEFLKCLPSRSVDLIITDPAYSGMNQHLMLGRGRIVGKYNERGNNGRWFTEFHDTVDNYRNFLEQCERVMKPNRHLFIMFDSFSLLSLGYLLREFFNVKNIVVWDKINLGMGHYFRRQSEFIVFACKGKRGLTRKDIPDVWKIKRIHRAPYPTQKPVELFEAMIASSKEKEDHNFIVCDPFVGSGSAAIAALKQGAAFVGCDIAEKAIEICRERIRAYIESNIDIYQPNPSFDESIQKKFW